MSQIKKENSIEISYIDELASTVDQENYAVDQASFCSRSVTSNTLQQHDSVFEASTVWNPHPGSPYNPYNFPVKNNNVNENVLQKEVVHRNTGKISLESFRHRRLLSQANAFGNSATDAQSDQGSRAEIVASQHPMPTQQQSQPTVIIPSALLALCISPVFPTNDNKDHVQQVIQQQQHQQPVVSAVANQADSPRNEPAYCAVCEQWYKSRPYLKRHEKTKKHIDNLEKLQQKG